MRGTQTLQKDIERRCVCRTFAANAARLQLHALAYNLGNFLRTLATLEPIKDWFADEPEGQADQGRAQRVVSHGRYVAFQMAEVAIPRRMFQEILRLIAELRPLPPHQHETPMSWGSMSTDGRSGAKCQGKPPDQAARLPAGHLEW